MNETRTARVNPAAEPRRQWTAVLLAVVLLGVEAVIVAESWRGLTGFAHLIGITGRAAWGVPVTLDGVSLVAALVALRAELAGEASGLYRVVLFAFTAASAAANWWHGLQSGGREAAVYLGGMSVAVAVVFALALRQIRHEDRRRAGTVTGRLPRFSVAHWLRYPGLTWQAWSLAVRDGHTSPRIALDAAIADRSGRSSQTGRQTGSGRPAGQVAGPVRKSLSGPVRNRPANRSGDLPRTVTGEDAEQEFAADIAAGQVPSLYQIRNRLHVGNDKAKALRQHIARQALST